MPISTPDAVNQIVALLADTEALVDQAKNKLDQLPALFKAINENGHIGLSMKADVITFHAGTLISTASSLRARASDLTEAAKQRGIDIPSVFSGGGR